MELSPGLRRIGTDLVAVHLLPTPEGVTIVDAGFAGHYRRVTAELRSIGATWSDVAGIVLTHGDTDHIGFAERARAEHDLPVYVQAADAARARGQEATHPAWGRWRLGATAQFMGYGAINGALRTHWLTDVTTFTGDEVLSLPGSPRAIPVPGHSPGSVAIHFPAVRALFVGDALATRHVLTGRRGIQPAPFTDDPAQAYASLEHLAVDPSLSGDVVEWIIPGHGAPYRGGVEAMLADYRAARG